VTNRSDRTLNRLSVAASFGLVLMVGATTGYVAWPRVAHAFGIKPAVPPPAPPAYVAGEQIDVPAAWYNAAPKTLVLFARESCGACQKAQPFLKALVTSLDGRASVLMAHPAGTDMEDAAFAKSLGIGDANVRAGIAGLRVHATPTLVLVNQQGAILAAWEGAGKADKQADIQATIERLTK
jgi:thiol-disulfide isomerase/thioredoxin